MSSLQTVPTSAKYGLIRRQGDKPRTAVGLSLGRGGGAATRSAPRSAQTLGKAFLRPGDSDDELEEDMTSNGNGRPSGYRTGEIGRANRDILQQRSIPTAQAADVDVSCYDYDGAYDSFKASTSDALGTHALNQSSSGLNPPKSRYISNLKSMAAVREKEKDRIYERRVLKERLEEEKALGMKEDDTPKYVTSAYKKKLMEEQKWDYEDKLISELEKKQDVRKQEQGMAGFYSSLLTKNIAYGGDVSTAATSAYTVGSARQAKYINTPQEDTSEVEESKTLPTDTKVGEKRNYQEDEEDITPKDIMEKEMVPTERSTECPMKPEKESKEAVLAAARARFLERKKQKVV